MWQEDKFEQICSRESLTEKAAQIEKNISVKEHERKRHDLDPTMFYENCFWNQMPDGIVINKNEQIELQAKLLNYLLGSNKSNINHRTLRILKFKRSCDRNQDFGGKGR